MFLFYQLVSTFRYHFKDILKNTKQDVLYDLILYYDAKTDKYKVIRYSELLSVNGWPNILVFSFRIPIRAKS